VMRSGTLFGAVEAGGTKFLCGVGDAVHGSRERATVLTGDPASTLSAVEVFFYEAQARHGRIAALGIG
jgi:fructokinase